MTDPRIVPRFPRPPIWFWVAVIAGAIATSLVVLMLLGVSDEASDRADEAEDRVERLEERLGRAEAGVAVNAQQLEDLGAEPLVQPEDIDGDVVVIPGPRGADGTDGKDGTPGINGADGANGVDGIDGIDGEDGEDGIDGEDGQDGADGTDGVDGQDGADGLPGETVCPDGFQFMDVTIPSEPDLIFRLCAAPAG